MKNTTYLNHMDYLYTIYQERSFTRAAEKLYISQPSLSLTVKKIENEIGHPIFERSGKEIVLTPIGEKYIKAIEDIMKIHTKLAAEVDDVLKLDRGSIAIGSTTFVASYILPQVLKDFRDRYPEIEVSVVVDQSSELEAKLENNELDIVIDNVTTFLTWYSYTPMLTERILLGIPKSLPVNGKYRDYEISQEVIRSRRSLSGLPRIGIDKFAGEKFILQKRGNKMRQIARHIFDEKKTIPIVAMEFDRMHTAVSYANAGFGLCFLSDITLRYSNACNNLSIYLPDTDYNEHTLYIIIKKTRYLSNAAGKLVGFLSEKSF